jgi:hypothetical protein
MRNSNYKKLSRLDDKFNLEKLIIALTIEYKNIYV